MDQENLELVRAYGYFLRLAHWILEDELTESEYLNFCSNPGNNLGLIMKKLGLKKLNDRDEEQLMTILNLIDHEKVKNEYLNLVDQGPLLLAYFQYDSNWMTRKEAADELGLSVQAVDKLFKSGSLLGFKDPGNGSIKIFKRSVEIRKRSKSD